MSSVYKAHDRLLDRQIAVKILHPHFTDDEEYVERFRREARAGRATGAAPGVGCHHEPAGRAAGGR